jgi:chromosomal replication initiation ATPase DnaA
MGDIKKHLKDLEKEFANQPVNRPFQAYKEKRSRAPINLVLKVLLIFACLTYLLDRYFDPVVAFLPEAQQTQLRVLLKKNASARDAHMLEEENYPAAASSQTQDGPRGTSPHSPSATIEEFVDGQTNLPEGANPDQYVQISGQYFKKTHNKVYIVNGRRVFFDDNLAQERKKQMQQQSNQ